MRPSDPEDLIRRPPAEVETDAAAQTPQVRLERYQQLEHFIRELPLSIDPYLELAEIYIKASRWIDARRVLEKAVDRFPEDEQARFLLEESQLARSQQLLAVTEQEVAADASPITQKKLDDCRLELNTLRARIFRARLQRNPENTDLLVPLAEALQKLDRMEEAAETLRQAAAEPELRAEASLRLGTLLEKMGDVPGALSAYRRSALFRIPPPDSDLKIQALQAAADLSQRQHLFHSARRYLMLLHDLQPGEGEWKQRLKGLESKI